MCTCTVPSPICITSIVYVCNSALQWSLLVKATFWLYIYFFPRLKRLLVHPYKTACWHGQLLFDHILMCELERVTKWNWVLIMMLYWTQLWNVTAVSPSISFQDTVSVFVFEFVGILKKCFWPILWHCAVFPVITTSLFIYLTLFCIWLPGTMTHTCSVYCSYCRKQHSTGLNYVNIHLFLYSESTRVWVRECTDTCVFHFIYGLRVLYPFRVN